MGQSKGTKASKRVRRLYKETMRLPKPMSEGDESYLFQSVLEIGGDLHRLDQRIERKAVGKRQHAALVQARDKIEKGLSELRMLTRRGRQQQAKPCGLCVAREGLHPATPEWEAARKSVDGLGVMLSDGRIVG